ncbi:MAG: DoxX family protein [Xanthobacteraceae bacterium]
MARGTKLYIPALGRFYDAAYEYAEPLLRIALGGILIPHGMQKLFGAFGGMGLTANAQLFERIGYHPGMFWGTLVGLTEFIGGILLVLGLFTRAAALAVTIFMLNAVYVTSKAGGFFWTNRGSEFSILILAVAVFFLIRGGGTWSVDEKLGREL